MSKHRDQKTRRYDAQAHQWVDLAPADLPARETQDESTATPTRKPAKPGPHTQDQE